MEQTQSLPDGLAALETAKLYSLPYNESYRRHARRKMIVALSATLLLLVISILMVIVAGA